MNWKLAESSKSFIYELNAMGENEWWLQISPGRSDDGKRTTSERLDAIGDSIINAQNEIDRLTEENKLLHQQNSNAFEQMRTRGNIIERQEQVINTTKEVHQAFVEDGFYGGYVLGEGLWEKFNDIMEALK